MEDYARDFIFFSDSSLVCVLFSVLPECLTKMVRLSLNYAATSERRFCHLLYFTFLKNSWGIIMIIVLLQYAYI